MLIPCVISGHERFDLAGDGLEPGVSRYVHAGCRQRSINFRKSFFEHSIEFERGSHVAAALVTQVIQPSILRQRESEHEVTRKQVGGQPVLLPSGS